jgi:hypothetical protein
MVIGHSLLYQGKDGAVCCMMFIDLLGDDGCLTGSKYSRLQGLLMQKERVKSVNENQAC